VPGTCGVRPLGWWPSPKSARLDCAEISTRLWFTLEGTERKVLEAHESLKRRSMHRCPEGHYCLCELGEDCDGLECQVCIEGQLLFLMDDDEEE